MNWVAVWAFSVGCFLFTRAPEQKNWMNTTSLSEHLCYYFDLLKWFLFCNTNRGPQLSSGKESDEDGLLLERILVQTYIKMPIFDQMKHLASVVSCREWGAGQAGAEAPVPSSSGAHRVGCFQVHGFAAVTGEGREFLRFSTAWLNILRVFHFLHALFRALKGDYGLTSALYEKAGLAMLCAHIAKHPAKGRKNSRIMQTGPWHPEKRKPWFLWHLHSKVHVQELHCRWALAGQGLSDWDCTMVHWWCQE